MLHSIIHLHAKITNIVLHIYRVNEKMYIRRKLRKHRWGEPENEIMSWTTGLTNHRQLIHMQCKFYFS